MFNEVVANYSASVYSIAYRYTNDHGHAEDLTQEIFLKIYKNLSKFKKDSKLSTWIYRIAVNTCIDWCRKNSKVHFVDSEVLSTTESALNVEEKIIKEEQHLLVHNIVYSLPEIYKTIIILYHFNNLSYKEISSILDISEKTIETRLYRARRKIKEALLHENGGENNEIL